MQTSSPDRGALSLRPSPRPLSVAGRGASSSARPYPSPCPRPHSRRSAAGDRSRGRRLVAGLALLAAAASSSCAGLSSERHLAPLYSQLSPAGGGTDTELFGGMLRNRTDPYTGRSVEWSFRPFFSLWPKRGSDYEARFLPPLGRFERVGLEKTWYVIPIFRYHSRIEQNDYGEDRWVWNFLMLPGLYLSRHADGRRVSALFPIYGSVKDFLSFDRADFFLFPLWARTQRGDRVRYHFLWPFFLWSNGVEGRSWRIWPLIGRNEWEGHYDRWFFLWPIFTWQSNRELYGEEQEQKLWTAWPLYGRSSRDGYTSQTYLWPFFGYGSHESNGWWSFDGPWPLVRILEPGETDGPKRYRFWPFYSYYEGDGLQSRWFLWPFINLREEEYASGRQGRSTNVLPFYRAEDDWIEGEDGERQDEAAYRKVWPLWRTDRGEDHSSFSFLELNPLWRTPMIDYHWEWLWQLYIYDREEDRVSQRSWLGIWRRETDADEDRSSIAGLYASRSYTDLGRRVTERSVLFGLLRWRMHEDDGFGMLAPALPGPGWPIDRMPNSILPEPPPLEELEEL